MLSKFRILSIVFVFGLFFIPSFSYAGVIISNEGSSIDMENFGTSAWKGQSFEYSSSFSIGSIQIYGGRGATPASTLDVSLYEGDGNGGTLVCTESVDVSLVPEYTSPIWVTLDFPCPSLDANQRYTFEIDPYDGSSNDAFRWASSDATYSDGNEWYNGSERSRDSMFRILDDSVDSVPFRPDGTQFGWDVDFMALTLSTMMSTITQFILGLIYTYWPFCLVFGFLFLIVIIIKKFRIL